jgi:hypothetical protein
MIFLYNLKKQQESLKKYTSEVAKRKKQANVVSAPACRQALEKAMHSYPLYTVATQSVWGKIKSYIPFSAVFKCRVRCARDINNAFTLLRQVDEQIEQKLNVKTSSKTLSVNGSSSELPTMYGNPIHTGGNKKPPVLSATQFIKLKPSLG